ncbi:MAG: hypothetical protein EZS28_012829 [Streblomastix strix]|uniref:Uncharacterized protein n=1 Tax=Streblomastix strix TaxID=222440 RepID=A0A5J4W9U2_9EUKA|nr:MAG: hypothetical protein EZS28_012829 [Streblomastix strix]
MARKSLFEMGFGIIAEGAEIFNNIPISNKDFRAITYDEKEGTLRLGWLEVFKWNYSPKDTRQPWITLEVDLREEIEHNTVRLFIGAEESPVIFMDVPKKMKIYIGHDNQNQTSNKFQLFKIPKPANARKVPYSKIIDYNMNIQYEQQEGKDKQQLLIKSDIKSEQEIEGDTNEYEETN